LYSADKMDIYNSVLKKKLSKNRYIHSVNVANQAKELAEKYDEDCEKAYLAGLLHDICKEMPLVEQESLVKKSALNVSDIEISSTPLWHAIAGAEYVKNYFNINDFDFINSIRYHTVARFDMSLLEKIVYLADAVSIDRKYDDVKKYRKLCFKDLDKAMFETLKFSISNSISNENSIPLYTLEAYNQYSNMLRI